MDRQMTERDRVRERRMTPFVRMNGMERQESNSKVQIVLDAKRE